MADTLAESRVRLDPAALRALCRRHRVRRLSLYGSVLRPDFRPDSDVDLLVEFEPGRVPGLLGFIALQEELADLLGAEVDLVSSDGLSPYMRDEILASRSSLYEG